MNMIEFLEWREEIISNEIRAKQKERRELRSALMRLRSEQLNPVPEKSLGGNNRIPVEVQTRQPDGTGSGN